MLKHQEIIDKLTIEQKVSLLADVAALGSVSLEGVDFPFLSLSSIQEENARKGEKFPSFYGLTNSWNPDLVGAVANRLACRAKQAGVTLLQMPEMSPKSTPYASGVSEDTHLSGVLSAAVVGAGKRVRINTCIDAPAIRTIDMIHSDNQADERVAYEYYFKPFEEAFKVGISAVCASSPNVSESYQKLNAEYLGKLEDKKPILRECRSAQETLQFIRNGGTLCLKGSTSILKAGVEKYQALRKAFERGEISLNEIETACKNGDAVSLEDLDVALDYVLEFTEDCARTAQKSVGVIFKDTEEKVSLLAAEESIVLLKNEQNILPLNNLKIALIGDLAQGDGSVESLKTRIEKLSANREVQLVGYAQGYNINEDRSESNTAQEKAVALAKTADVAIVVLGYDKTTAARADKNRMSKLPANQLALLSALSKTGVKIVAIVGGERYPDMSFDGVCSAVLLAPLGSSRSAQALAKILKGKANPSGRLATTCYNDTEERFDTLRAYKEAGRNKVGAFFGYRHYDISGVRPKYPFGFGLSYTKFEYGKIQHVGDGVQFSVKNTGKMSGAEVVQVYVGKKDSKIVRPLKELKCFQKIYLQPGETKTLYVPFSKMDLSVWNRKRKAFQTEKGYYELYVGSSVKDIYRQTTFYFGTDKVDAETSDVCEYVQAKTNIHKEKYYLDVPMKLPTDARAKNRKTAFGFSIAIICLDILYAYFDYVRWLPKKWWLYVIVLIVNALPIAFTVGLTLKRQKEIKESLVKNMEQKTKKRQELNMDDLADELPYEALFEEEFQSVYTVEETPQEEERHQEKSERIRESAPVDRQFTFSMACDELATFTHERGVTVEKQSVRALFSAFASSRLIVLKSEEKELLGKFVTLLTEYFNCSPITATYNGDSSLFSSNIAARIVGMSDEDGLVHIVALKDIKSENLKTELAPVVRYIDQPEHNVEITLDGQSHELANSLWFIVTLAEEEKVTDIPKYILDMASVVDLSLRVGEEPKKRMVVQKEPIEETPVLPVETDENEENTESTETDEKEANTENAETEETPIKEIKFVETVVEKEKTSVKHITCWQFVEMVRIADREYALDEILWKRVDKLEEYIRASGEFRIENKLWQRMEKYVSVYLASGGLEEEALDNVMASHLVQIMLVCLVNGKKQEEKFAHTLENVCGEGHVPHCLKAVKLSGLLV